MKLLRACFYSQKRSYRTKIDALLRNDDLVGASAYRCHACGYWHITSRRADRGDLAHAAAQA
jgi:hypothetical protein